MSTDASPEYVAAVDQALATVAEPRPQVGPLGLAYGMPITKPGHDLEWVTWSAANPRLSQPAAPRVTAQHRAFASVWRVLRSAAITVAALAGLLVLSVQGAAVLVDWFAPVPGPSACSQVALPLVLSVGALAVVGLAGAVVREVAARRRGDTS